MIKKLIAFASTLLILTAAFAQPIPFTLEITEEDSSPATYPYKIKFTNTSVTDNGDGTVSIDVSGGAGSGDNVTVNGTAVDTTANFADDDVVFTLVDGGAGGPDDVKGSFATDSIDNVHINWADIDNLGNEGAVTLAATVTVNDDEATDDNQEIVFTTDNVTLESDGDFHYSPDTGTVTVTEVVGGGAGITGIEGTQVLSTGEGGGTKFLREDGDNTCSWQAATAAFTDFDTDYGAETVTSAWTLNNIITLQTDAAYIPTAFTDEGLNAAIDALGATGGVVWLPEGTGVVDATITYDQNNTTVMGTGYASHIDASADQTNHAINLNGIDYIQLANLQIEGEDGGGNATYLIYDNNALSEYAQFENLNIHHSDNSGMYLDNGGNAWSSFRNLYILSNDGVGMKVDGDYNMYKQYMAWLFWRRRH